MHKIAEGCVVLNQARMVDNAMATDFGIGAHHGRVKYLCSFTNLVGFE